MKLLSIRVEHFRCIRQAKIDFRDGLNVLHGPNDLGKSSLAHAIRAALLLQTTAKEHEAFVSWHESGEPFVELVFESEPQRIWRVRKTFGTTSSFLDFSKDGVDFAPEVRGRQVDERLSEILRWGVAPPGGKGRPKGMPMTFLSTALIAEQDRVSAIFDQALSADSDESGKNQLISVLQAMAENPQFKAVLARVQTRVDEAFNISDGKSTKKRGRNSPWVKINEEIQRKQLHSHECEQELQKTAAIELEIQQLRDRRIALKDSANKAQESIEALQDDLAKQKRRQEIAQRLDECKAHLGAVVNELLGLAEAERKHSDGIRQVANLTNRVEEARVRWTASAERAQKAKDELARLQSEDRIRERQLEQSVLETRRADLRSEQLRQEALLGGIRAIEAAAAKVAALEAESIALGDFAVETRKARAATESARIEVEEQEREVRAVRSFFRWQTATDHLQQAEKGLAQLDDWRKEAGGKRVAAAALESAQPRFTLPASTQLDDLRRLQADMRVAAARAEVGLTVTMRPKRPLQIMVQRDGEQATAHELSGTIWETAARRKLQFDIEGVAEITLTGGPADAHWEIARLEKRWASEAVPLLKEAGASTVEELASVVQETVRRRSEIAAAIREAVQLEQRMADQPDWLSLVAERRKELAAAEKAMPAGDRVKAEKSARKLRAKDSADIEKRMEALRTRLETIAKEEQQRNSELAAAEARVTEKQKALDEARAESEQAQSDIGKDWEWVQRQVLTRQTGIQQELKAIEENLARLTVAGNQNQAKAQKAVDVALKELAESEAGYLQKQQDLTDATLLQATLEGAIQARREAAGRLDESGAREAVERVSAELRDAPAPAQPGSEEMLAGARRSFAEASALLEDLDGKIREKRGALQQVGGEVARQRAEDAAGELQSAKERADMVELEYEAWELLRRTLREAEQDEGTHLGNALAEPVAKRFAALTTGRYGKLALGPSLETAGISVAGQDRLLELLSVGTRDQLSIVFRLTLAEQLKTAVILDDQLTQTDSRRMLWIRELLKEVAGKIQVIVFTCRPDDYIAPLGGRSRKSEDELPNARAVDLERFIERWGKTASK
jgi:DNA repair exonuclease SbcCD ATPase subunit